jgi:Rrf2 family protein
MLKLSTKARYALRAMIELALHEGGGTVQLREVAKAQHLSPKYLEQLTIPLRHAGLVQTERGPHGGYELAKPATSITALDIVEAVEGPVNVLDCIGRSSVCDRTGACAARDLWVRLRCSIGEILSETTLADLRSEQQSAMAGESGHYQI